MRRSTFRAAPFDRSIVTPAQESDVTADPTDPDPDHFRSDDAVDKGQDLGRATTQMAEEDMAAAGSLAPAEGERRTDG